MAEIVGEQSREPQYIDEAEALIGSFFSDTQLANTLYFEGVKHLDTEDVAERHGLYMSALRILACERRNYREKRQSDSEVKSVAELNEAFANGLTKPRLAEVRSQHTETADFLASWLTALNNKTLAKEDVKGVYGGLFEHQKPYMRQLVDFLTCPPSTIIVPYEEDDTLKYEVKGAIVEAGTGIGKSALMGRTAVAARIGSPLPDGSRNHRLLIVSSSRLINRQLAGLVGDDTFRRFAPAGIDVECCNGKDDPDPNAAAVVATIEQYVKMTKNGLFCGQEFDLLLIDEAHQLTEPQFKQVFLSQWRLPLGGGKSRPIPAIGFTARTAYSEYKDAAALLPVTIKDAPLKDYMAKGILSAGQFYTVVAEPEYTCEGEISDAPITRKQANALRSEAILKTVFDMTVPLLKEGRRGIIFCEAGNNSYNAKELARQLGEVALDARGKVRTQAMWATDKSAFAQSMRAVAAYNEGDIDVLTTVGTGQQGLNADFNFVGICGNILSAQKLTQEIGRGMRPSKEFPVTVFFHVLAGYLGEPSTSVTFGDVLDADIQQGEVIAPQPVSGKVYSQSSASVPTPAPVPTGTESSPQPPVNAHTSTPASVRLSRQFQDKYKGVPVSRFNKTTQLLIKRVRTHKLQDIEITLNARVPIPPDYVSFEQIYATVSHSLSANSVKRRLAAAGYSWRGRRESLEDGTALVRYYEPSAASFFTENPLPPEVTSGMKSEYELATILGVSTTYLQTLRERMEKETELRRSLRLGQGRRPFYYHNPESIEWLRNEAAKIPLATPEHLIKKHLADKLGIGVVVLNDYLKEMEDVDPLYMCSTQRHRTYGHYYSPDQIAKISARIQQDWARPTDWTLQMIQDKTGVSVKAITGMLTDEERATICTRWRRNRSGLPHRAEHLPGEVAQNLVNRLYDIFRLPAHLLPYKAARRITNAPHHVQSKIMKEQTQCIRLIGESMRLNAIGWKGLEYAAAQYGWKGEPLDIDFDRLPNTDEDRDPDKVLYARAIQLRFMTAAYMGNPDGIID